MYVHLRRVGFDPPAGAVEVDDGAVELSLALSIGGSSQRAGGAPRRRGRDAEADLGGSGVSVSSSSTPPLPIREGSLDPRRRREMHALRRQEARMKRQDKQQKKGICRAGRDGTAPPETACLVDERVAMEAQAQRARVRDRLAREEGGRHSDWRTSEDHEPGSDFVPKPELCPIANGNPNPDANPNSGFSPNFCRPSLPPFSLSPLPAMALQYPYPRVQYLPIANGFGFPYMMPCWASGMSPVTGSPGAATNVLQPVACRAFQPLSPVLVDPTAIDGKVGDSGSEKGTGMKRAPSWTASLGSNSSSAISDHQSNSLQATISSTGGTSGSGSGMRSHPSNAHVERPQPQVSPEAGHLVQGQLEHSISSHQIEPEANSVEDPCGKRSLSTSPQQRGAPKGDSSCPPPCTPAKLEGSASVDKPASAADEPAPLQASSPLHRMPCVSTTGNGPNGKTIIGFLYRYTSAEVSIVCVCHGSSFSPAEFVKHAGGTDTVNPLRHIIVVPS